MNHHIKLNFPFLSQIFMDEVFRDKKYNFYGYCVGAFKRYGY